MQGVVIAGAGMTPFTRAPGTGVRELATRAATEALADAGIGNEAIRRIFFGNAAAASVTRQEMIRGQVAFRNLGLSQVPVVNVENACASGGSALMLGFESVASGLAEVVLVVGAEQLSHDRKERTFAALHGAMDIDEIGEFAPRQQPAGGSSLMEGYAAEGREYLEKYDADITDFACVAVKNRWHATVNSRAHFRKPQNIEQVLADRAIAAPLTLSMCSPITDGAAALVLCSDDYAKRHGIDGPKILASEIAPGTGRGSAPLRDAAAKAYEAAGVGPADMDVIELHDAAAPAELLQYSDLGLCGEGEGHHLLRRGDTRLGGKIPVNVSGGLMSRGHPLGATGCAQVFEIYQQLTGRADKRQVEGARLGLAANAGGWLGGSYAVGIATIISS